MLYLIWALLNVAAFVFFILLCVKLTKLIRQKLGLVSATVFVIALLWLVFDSNNDQVNQQANSNQTSTWKFTPQENIETFSARFHDLTLQRNLISRYGLSIRYGIGKGDQLNTPIDANSWTIGLVSGTKWEPTSITINKTDDNKKFQYSVVGTVDWKLAGIVIFSQSKEFKGTASIK